MKEGRLVSVGKSAQLRLTRTEREKLQLKEGDLLVCEVNGIQIIYTPIKAFVKRGKKEK